MTVGEPAANERELKANAHLASATRRASMAGARALWIFSRPVDLAVFALPAALSLAIVLLRAPTATVDDSPEWVWITGVLLVDVAHVWSTAFITYLDPTELRRHPERYWLVPGFGWVLGVVTYSLGGPALFWRALAYLAVFHFVRQQYGWMVLYRARAGDRSRLGAWIDGAAIYAATLYPLVWWHVHLPRRFNWFLPGDFFSGLPRLVADAAAVAYALCLAAYLLRALGQATRGDIQWGKHLLLAGTATTWYVGIVAYDDDTAFTLTNVLTHGIPYAALVFSYARFRAPRAAGISARLLRGSTAGACVRFLACLWLFAYVEELLWDRGVWHERASFFGSGVDLGSLYVWLVPLLALPQLTHYVLDGVFWRRGQNSELREWFGRTPSDPFPRAASDGRGQS